MIDTHPRAIKTKHIGPANYRGSRVKATADTGSVTVSWDYALGVEENHTRAAIALASKYGWQTDWWIGGVLGDVYVFVEIPQYYRST